jgi:hypothetical protein
MKSGYKITFSLLAAASMLLTQSVLAQDTSAGWKPVGASNQAPALQQNAPPYAAVDPAQAAPAAPPQLNLKTGTYIAVRLNQSLSSNKNQAGDSFTLSLVRPLVVDGFVAAQPGQTIAGKVTEAAKASSQTKDVSHLGLQLTNLTFVDGQQAAIQSELVAINGPAAFAHDPTTVGLAGGSAASILMTHGKATVIGPESVLTFKIVTDVAISTVTAPQAFRPVGSNDYSQPTLQAGRPGGYAPAGAYYAGAGYPYGYGYPYPYYGYPYYWGPSVGLYFGGGFGPRFGGGFRGRIR